MIAISKTHTETETEKISNTDNIYRVRKNKVAPKVFCRFLTNHFFSDKNV